MSETQPKLIETEHQKRLSEKEAAYLKTIAELKAWQEKEKIANELTEMLKNESPSPRS